jgi:hypothetical protein
MKRRLKRALMSDTGNIRYYAEAFEVARGIELKYSVEVDRCIVSGLSGIDAAKLYNQLVSLLKEGKWGD